MSTNTPEIVALGERPEPGVVPEKMHAFVVRQDRFGEPGDAGLSAIRRHGKVALRVFEKLE